MRPTLEIDYDLLIAVKEIAGLELRSAVSVVLSCESRHVRGTRTTLRATHRRVGSCPYPSRGEVVTNQLIDRLR